MSKNNQKYLSKIYKFSLITHKTLALLVNNEIVLKINKKCLRNSEILSILHLKIVDIVQNEADYGGMQAEKLKTPSRTFKL
jgi:hypothetical protein